MKESYKTLMMNSRDSVVVALEAIPEGTVVHVECEGFSKDVRVRDSIQFGHKFAVAPIEKGSDIIKYGEVIGAAVCKIEEGSHVHVHNLEGKRGRGDKVGTT